MSPKAKSSLLNLGAMAGAIIAIAGLTSSAKRLADSTYVRTDTFAVWQVQQQGKSTVDSLEHSHELERIDDKLAAQDTMLREVRATLRRMEQRGR